MAETATASAPLDDIMLAMDVVDTLRHREHLVARELAEDARGLFAKGRLMPEVTRAREVLSLMRAGALDGLSIGFRTVQGRTDPASGVRRLDKIDLWEISIVTFPMLPQARVSAVKRQSAFQPREGQSRLRAPGDLPGFVRALRRGAALMRG